ncbi:MAG: hypothetical protein JWN67_840 [Actinomycetia bacterium]|nr:hypothetical protein [Actinomycetes bacterium]
MRKAAPLLLVALLAAACGSGGDGLSTGDARALADKIQLTQTDLGTGWTQTAEERPDQATGDKELERCVGTDLDVADDTLAQAVTRTFERTASDVDRQQLVVSGAVLASRERADQLFPVIATQRFADCITRSFEDQLQASEDDVTFERGDSTITRGHVAGADHSAHISAPFTLTVAPLTLQGRVDLVMVSTGQAFSLLYGFSYGSPIGEAALGHLGELLARRQKA